MNKLYIYHELNSNSVYTNVNCTYIINLIVIIYIPLVYMRFNHNIMSLSNECPINDNTC